MCIRDRRCPNVYLVPDCYVYIDCMPFADTYIEAANSFLKYRTIFGSTYPERSLKQTIEGWKKRPWDPEEMCIRDSGVAVEMADHGKVVHIVADDRCV